MSTPRTVAGLSLVVLIAVGLWWVNKGDKGDTPPPTASVAAPPSEAEDERAGDRASAPPRDTSAPLAVARTLDAGSIAPRAIACAN